MNMQEFGRWWDAYRTLSIADLYAARNVLDERSTAIEKDIRQTEAAFDGVLSAGFASDSTAYKEANGAFEDAISRKAEHTTKRQIIQAMISYRMDNPERGDPPTWEDMSKTERNALDPDMDERILTIAAALREYYAAHGCYPENNFNGLKGNFYAWAAKIIGRSPGTPIRILGNAGLLIRDRQGKSENLLPTLDLLRNLETLG